MTLSLCMIVKNEEAVLERCLASTSELFDEIIIIDTGSTDKTKEIASKFTNKIYDFEWINDFSIARNYSFSKATMDYVMWLDADDIILKEDLMKLIELKKDLVEDIIMLKYNIGFDQFGRVNFSYYRERIFKRSNNYKWKDKVHEYIEMYGNMIKKDIAITHKKKYIEGNSDRNLKIYEKMEKEKQEFSPRNYYYYGRELYDHRKYKKAIKILNKFLDTHLGWVEDNINACIILSNCSQDINYLFRTFQYDVPRAKACCLIGNHFTNQQNYEKAIFWYELIFSLNNEQDTGFYEKEYSTFIPSINLCMCYSKLHNLEKSYFYHQKSKEYNSQHPSVLYNNNYFNEVLLKNQDV